MRLSEQTAVRQLLGRVRAEVMGIVLSEPQRVFYQREVAERVEANLSAVQRELVRLEAAGLIVSRRSGGRVYYQANAAHPLFPELHALALKSGSQVAMLRGALEILAGQIAVAFIYGSIATGEATADSDVDVMIIGDVGLRDLVGLLPEVEERLGREVNPVTLSPAEWSRRLGEHEPFLEAVASGPKVFLIGEADDLEGIAGQGETEGAGDFTAGN
jgi:predicted nucleotidyltransferase/DNA-binding transcriptional regulator YhcF (GntR family)